MVIFAHVEHILHQVVVAHVVLSHHSSQIKLGGFLERIVVDVVDGIFQLFLVIVGEEEIYRLFVISLQSLDNLVAGTESAAQNAAYMRVLVTDVVYGFLHQVVMMVGWFHIGLGGIAFHGLENALLRLAHDFALAVVPGEHIESASGLGIGDDAIVQSVGSSLGGIDHVAQVWDDAFQFGVGIGGILPYLVCL